MTDPTPTPSPLDLAALTAIAKAATPGPWDHHSFGNSGSDEPETIIVHAGAFDWPAINDGDYIVSTPRWDADEDMNARHIAAFDPPTVLALIARIKELEAMFLDKFARYEGAKLRAEAAECARDEAVVAYEAAEAAVARARELARAWAQRGEHTMKYAATCPEDVRETLHENGADMLDSARKVIAALDGTA